MPVASTVECVPCEFRVMGLREETVKTCIYLHCCNFDLKSLPVYKVHVSE